MPHPKPTHWMRRPSLLNESVPADEGKEAIAETDAVEFGEWIDGKLDKRILARLKDSPRWFYNHKPHKIEGEQHWLAYTTSQLYQLYKQSK